MTDTSETLAKSITLKGSKQTYFIARMMVDIDLVNDFFRAYAYFRWADDIVDAPTSLDSPSAFDVKTSMDSSAQTRTKRIAFINRQKDLIDSLYNNERPEDMQPEEEILADLIKNDRGEDSGLQSFIRNMFAIIEFDALRTGQLINQEQLSWYTNCLAKSVTDGLQYFVGNGQAYPDSDGRYLAAKGAHIAHLLRDTTQDTSDGFINIPREYLEANGIKPEDMDSLPYRAWVQSRTKMARDYFREGKRYLDRLWVLRCKIVGYWYCARFEGVLDAIERDDYILRAEYNERRKLSVWLKIAWLSVSITLHHIVRRVRRGSSREAKDSRVKASSNKQ